MPLPTTPAPRAAAAKHTVGDEEEAKEAPALPPAAVAPVARSVRPSSTHIVTLSRSTSPLIMAPPFTTRNTNATDSRRGCVDTAGVAPGREGALRHHYV